MAALAKQVLNAATVTGPGSAIDLTVQARSLTMQTLVGGAIPDPNAQVKLEVSLDGVNFWSIGTTTGTNILNNDQDVCQYVRGNVISIASGNVTAWVGYVSG